MRDAVGRLASFGELDVEAAALPRAALTLSDEAVRDILAEATLVLRHVGTLQSVLAGVAAARSGRDRGHGGFVQGTGHRNAVEFLRDVMGSTRAEATRAVRVGESLLEGADAGRPGAPDAEPDGGPDSGSCASPWHAPLGQALLAGELTTAKHHAIRGGLGEPPAIDGRESDAVIEAWRAAARELVWEARLCTVEDLGARARALRDLLDPAGAEERYAGRFAKRSYRWSTTADGQPMAHITFDDEMGAWVRSVMDAALAPRRGGPRFVEQGAREVATELARDPRTNDQLAYDLFADLLRAGALADASDVFGAREVGVRLVTIADSVMGDSAHRDAFGRLVATAFSEDGSLVIPGSVLERALCATGTASAIVDRHGNPLDLGREARLFTAKQRAALGVRDGGCVWPGCDRPPAYCEAHHCDHWADGGRTDCDVGVLLCRFHHLNLHNGGWRITRTKARGAELHPPGGGAPVALPSRSPLRWLWDPPPERARWRAAA